MNHRVSCRAWSLLIGYVGWLASLWNLPSPPQHWGCRCVMLCWTSDVGAGDPNLGLLACPVHTEPLSLFLLNFRNNKISIMSKAFGNIFISKSFQAFRNFPRIVQRNLILLLWGFS